MQKTLLSDVTSDRFLSHRKPQLNLQNQVLLLSASSQNSLISDPTIHNQIYHATYSDFVRVMTRDLKKLKKAFTFRQTKNLSYKFKLAGLLLVSVSLLPQT